MTDVKRAETAKTTENASEQDVSNHPLAAIMGKFGGEFWEATLAEIKRRREQDQEELSTADDVSIE